MKHTRLYLLQLVAVFTSFVVGLILFLAPGVLLEPTESKAAGLAVITIALFATGLIPEYLTALLFFCLAMLFRVAPGDVVFSGFGSAALWLVFGGLVLGAAIAATGLGRRIAGRLASHLEGSYPKLIAGMTTVGVLFAFIMPSAMGRVMLLVPIAIALADHFGFEKGSNGRTGVILATTLGAYVPAFSVLPANVPNMILAGLAESQLNVHVLFGEYLLLHFPILGLAKAAVIVVSILWLYPDHPVARRESGIDGAGPMSSEEKRLALVLCVLLSLWLTDSVHGVSPAWVALGGAVLLLLPGVGVVSHELFTSRINYGSLFFVAGVMGLGSIIRASGLGGTVGGVLISALPLSAGTPFVDFVSVSLSSTLTGLLTTLPGVPAVLTPFAGEIAQATGLPLKSVLMMQVAGFSTVLVPYQAPPLVVALHLSGENPRSIARIIVLLAVVTYVVFLPVDYVWWRLLGWL